MNRKRLINKNKPPTSKRKKKIFGFGTYLGLPIDSNEERLFLFWCEELFQQGYIEKVTRADSYLLTDGVQNSYSFVKQLKTKSKPITKTEVLLEPSSYNPDFAIYWTPKGREKFCWLLVDDHNSKCDKLFIDTFHNQPTIIEVKGNFDANNMIRLWKNNQKFLYYRYKVFTNLVIPDKLFEQTFLPHKASFTLTGKQRKINFKPKTIKQYLNI